MAEITPDEVRKVAALARLRIEAGDEETFAEQLTDILAAVDKLRELDTTGVEPTAHILPLRNVMREDTVRPSLPQDAVLANAPDSRDGFFRVPRVLEE